MLGAIGSSGPSRRLLLPFENSVEFGAGHLQFIRMLIDPLGQGIILSRGPTSFKFGAVFPEAVKLEVEGVLEIGELGRDNRLLGEYRRDKDHAVRFGEDKISRKHSGAADADRGVDGGERHLGPGGGIIATIETVEVGDFAVFFGVANAGVKDKPGVGMGGDAVAKIGTNQGTFDDLADSRRPRRRLLSGVR